MLWSPTFAINNVVNEVQIIAYERTSYSSNKKA